MLVLHWSPFAQGEAERLLRLMGLTALSHLSFLLAFVMGKKENQENWESGTHI